MLMEITTREREGRGRSRWLMQNVSHNVAIVLGRTDQIMFCRGPGQPQAAAGFPFGPGTPL